MKKIFIFCFGINCCIYSQAFLKSTFDIDSNEGFYDACKINNNEMLLLGGSHIVSKSPNYTPDIYGSFILTQVNSLGSILDVKELELVDPVIPGCIKKTMDGGYIIVGGMIPASTSYRLIVKLDSNLQLQWERQWDYGMLNDIEETPSAYIAVGAVPTGEGMDWSCTKLTKSGGLIWDITYSSGSDPGNTTDDEAFDLIVEDDGELTIIGKYYDVINHMTYDYNCGIIHADSSGNIIWQRKIYGGGFGRSIFQLESGSYIGCSLNIVFKLSPNGNFSWSKDGMGWAERLISSPDHPNECILMGHKSSTSDAYSAIIDTNGTFVCYNNYDFGEESHFHAMLPFNDNHWMACGIEYIHGFNNYDSTRAALIMGNRHFRVLPGCQDTLLPSLTNVFPNNSGSPLTQSGVLPMITNNSVHVLQSITNNGFDNLCTNGIGIEEQKEWPFTVYPNPVTDILVIAQKDGFSYENIVVFNTLGDVVYKSIENTVPAYIHMANFSPGIYFLVIQTADKMYSSRIVR